MPYRRTENVSRRLAARHAAIIAAARQVASEGGMAAVQIAPVADRAGVAAGTVYRYFPAKADLVATLIAQISEREIAVLRRAAAAAPGPLSAIAAAITTFAARALRHRRLAFAVIAEPIDAELEPARLSFRRALAGEFAALITAAVAGRHLPEQNAALSAAALLGLWSKEPLVRSHQTLPGVSGNRAIAHAARAACARCCRCAGARSRRADRSPTDGAIKHATQCDISTGTVIDRKMLRVTPPSTNSRSREWP